MNRGILLSALVLISICHIHHGFAQSALPVPVQVDMLKRSIVKAYADGNTTQVLADMERYHALADKEKGVAIPGPLLFIEAKVASSSNLNIRAESALRKYFEVVDANDPRYNEALELYPGVQALVEAEVAENKRLEAVAEQRRQEERRKAVQPRLGPMLEEVRSQMVVIPAGKFRMGCSRGDRDCYSDEKPERDVNVGSFRMGKYEVTFVQYDVFADATGRKPPSDSGWGRANRPVINVNRADAQAYVQWLSEQTGLRFRLPSEAEWEYAARAGSKTKYSWGSSIGSGKANCYSECSDAFEKTAPVGSFEASAFGLFDMHGNVWE